MFKFKLQKQLKLMSVFRHRKGWRNDVQQIALLNMPDITAGRRTDSQIAKIIPFLMRFKFFREMDQEEVIWMSQFLVFRRLSDNQTIFRAGGSEKFFLVVHGKVTVSMLVPKSQLAAQTLRRLERRKLEREQKLAAQKAAHKAASAKKEKDSLSDFLASGVAPNIGPASPDPRDDADKGEDTDRDKAGDKHEEYDPFSMMEVPKKKYYIGDYHRADIAKTGAKITSTTRAAACGHTEVILIKRKALALALETRRIKKNLEVVEMFKPMTVEAIKDIMQGSHARVWRHGQVLVRDGSSISRCIVLTKGTVQLEWALPNVSITKRKHGSEYGAALAEASRHVQIKGGEPDKQYQENVTKMAKETVERARRVREMESTMSQPTRYVLLTTLLKGDIIGLLEVLNNLKMPYQVRATSLVEGMMLSADYLQKTPQDRRQADESSSLVLLDSLSRRIEEQVNLLSSHDILETNECPVTMEHIRGCQNWRTYTANLKLLKLAKGLDTTNQILKKATSLWKKLKISKSFIGEAKSDRRRTLKRDAVDALARGRKLPIKPSKAIGYEQETVHEDAKNAVVRKIVPKLANKLEKFRHRNELSATFLTHLDKFAVHKPPKSAAATKEDEKNQSTIVKNMSDTVGSLPKI